MNERDTKYLGFAKLVTKELQEAGLINLSMPDLWKPQDVVAFEQLTARRAYDLVAHTLEWCRALELDLEWIDSVDPASRIPDIMPGITQWPDLPTTLPDAPTTQEP